MREFSKVSPTVWKSRKFSKLPNIEARHVYLYLLTCPHGNSAGCFDLVPGYACADLGMTEIEYRRAIDTLSKADLVRLDEDENTILIVNWEEFNAPTNYKHAIGLLTQLDRATSVALKQLALNTFLPIFAKKGFDKEKALMSLIDSLSIAYGKGIATKTRDQDQREEKGMLTHPQKDDPPTDVSRVSKPDPRGCRLPADWVVTDEIADWARGEMGLTRQQVEHEVPIFTDYWNAQAGAKGRKTDWDATFRNWLRRSQESRGKSHGTFKRNTPGSQLRDAFAAQREHLVNTFGEPETGDQDA
jgi:hypothetical protein